MKPFLNILVGINYSNDSRLALTKAAEIAAHEGAKVTACHILPIDDLGEYINFYQVEHKSMMAEARQSLLEFTTDVLGPNHNVTCEVSEGSPHHEISAIADENNYDLLILGDGDDSAAPRDLGTFAIRCLRFVTIPVLIVNRTAITPAPPIAACLDFSDSTTPILENASRLTAGHTPPLELIHACRPPWLRSFLGRLRDSSSDDSGQKESFREIIDGRLTTIAEQARALSFPAITSTRLEDKAPEDALINHLRNNPFSLIVLGRSGQGFKGLLSDVLGSTANDIIRNARCPVLIVPLDS